MRSLTFSVRGVSPLLMHSDAGIDPLSATAKQIRSFTKKRVKTDEDVATIAYLEWKAGIYFDPSVGVYVPAQNIHASIAEAARSTKSGKKAKSAVFVSGLNGEENIPLQYEGPTDLQGLWDGGFYDARSVRIGTSRVMRYRPIFRDWGLSFRVVFSPEILSEDEVKSMVEFAGDFCGLCDYRPRFGRFEISSVKES